MGGELSVGNGNIGLPVASSIRWLGYEEPDTEYSWWDSALVGNTNGLASNSGVLTWAGGIGAPLASAPAPIRGVSAAFVGNTVCRSGATTGWRCGVIIDVDRGIEVGDAVVNSIISTACALPGDSGGPAIVGSRAVGVLSWGDSPTQTACSPGQEYSGFFPMVSSVEWESIERAYGSVWELQVTVPAPAVASYSGISALSGAGGGPAAATATAIVGTLPGGTSGNWLHVTVDGTPMAHVAADSGTFSIPLSSVSPGIHRYAAEARWGVHSKGATTTGRFARSLTIER